MRHGDYPHPVASSEVDEEQLLMQSWHPSAESMPPRFSDRSAQRRGCSSLPMQECLAFHGMVSAAHDVLRSAGLPAPSAPSSSTFGLLPPMEAETIRIVQSPERPSLVQQRIMNRSGNRPSHERDAFTASSACHPAFKSSGNRRTAGDRRKRSG